MADEHIRARNEHIAPRTDGPLLHPTRPAAKPGAASGKAADSKDVFREIIETVVFVIVLVLLLKTFIAEAFVIPTGSMATTLLGYHRDVTCPKCGYSFAVNRSAEADEDRIQGRQPVLGCTCPNCRYDIWFDVPRQDFPPGNPQGGWDNR